MNTTISGYQYDWETIPFEKIGEGIERQMIVGENMMICRLRFAANTVTPAHEHPHEQMTIVEKGSVSFTLDEEQKVFTRVRSCIFRRTSGTEQQCLTKK